MVFQNPTLGHSTVQNMSHTGIIYVERDKQLQALCYRRFRMNYIGGTRFRCFKPENVCKADYGALSELLSAHNGNTKGCNPRYL